MKNCILIVLAATMLTLNSWAEELIIGGYTLDNPLGPTQVKRLGPDAWGCTWPQGATSQTAHLELVVVNFSSSAVSAITGGGGSMEDMALSTYFSLGGQPESVNKTLFLGGTSARSVYLGKHPREHEAHIFSKELEDGGFVMVGVRFFAPVESQTGALLQAVANTFRAK